MPRSQRAPEKHTVPLASHATLPGANHQQALKYEDANRAERKEPPLPWPDELASSETDAPPTKSYVEYQRLLAQTDKGMTKVISPAGREGGSSGVEFRINDEPIGRFGEPLSRDDLTDKYRRIADEIARSRRR